MRGDGEFAFARPIRWVLALLGDVVVPFEVGKVASGRVTQGTACLVPVLHDQDRGRLRSTIVKEGPFS